MPIYYVVCEQQRGTILSMHFQILDIIKVFECDISEIDNIYRKEIVPLQVNGRYFNLYIFNREVANPFKEFKKNGDV